MDSAVSGNPDLFNDLVKLNTDDLVSAFKLPRVPLVHQTASVAMRLPARRISLTIQEYDRYIQLEGLSAGSQWLVDVFVNQMHVYRPVVLPRNGPLLVVSNHPGMVDAMAIFASLRRDDLRIVAANRPILRLLRALDDYVIYVSEDDDDASRMLSVRNISRHLRKSGSALLFPAARIEPDPLIRPNAADSLAGWSQSPALLARVVPNLTILPVAVSGVLSVDALRHPITRLYHTQQSRDWVAATMMILSSRYRNVDVHVRYGTPIHTEDTPDISAAIESQMRGLIAQSEPESQS